VPGQYGQKPTPAEYVQTLVSTFAQARRKLLADDGTRWLNLGDCYAANSDGWARGSGYNGRQPVIRPRSRLILLAKDLLGMPGRVAFALQACQKRSATKVIAPCRGTPGSPAKNTPIPDGGDGEGAR
jgi:hypothetical protein